MTRLIPQYLRIHRESSERVRREKADTACRPLLDELELGAALRPTGGEDPARFTARIEAVVKGGAEGIDCHAAGFYLLDGATTSLRLAASWGLPAEREIEPPRPLRGALADLEALAGHAVVLEQERLTRLWHAPEPFASAICVPVASPTTILGTLWMFCRAERTFDARQTNQVEIVAGRLAAEVERDMLLGEDPHSERFRRGLADARRLQASAAPTVAPLLDGWDVAGRVWHGQGLGGTFYDWTALPDGSALLALGEAMEGGPAAALVASSLRIALRTHAQYRSDAGEVLTEANRTLWTSSAGDHFAAAATLRLISGADRLELAVAGRIAILLAEPEGWQSLPQEAFPLALQADSAYHTTPLRLKPGMVAVVHTQGLGEAVDSRGRLLAGRPLAEAVLPHSGSSAARVAEAIHELAEPAEEYGRSDLALLVVRRR